MKIFWLASPVYAGLCIWYALAYSNYPPIDLLFALVMWTIVATVVTLVQEGKLS